MIPDLADQLRAAIRTSGKSSYQLRAETGVAIPRISAFLAGGDMGLKNASKLAAALGIRLTKPRLRA